MIILLVILGLASIALYYTIKLPSSTQTMTEEEYRKYFATHMMGIKLS